jgi:hypothetical protein
MERTDSRIEEMRSSAVYEMLLDWSRWGRNRQGTMLQAGRLRVRDPIK